MGLLQIKIELLAKHNDASAVEQAVREYAMRCRQFPSSHNLKVALDYREQFSINNLVVLGGKDEDKDEKDRKKKNKVISMGRLTPLLDFTMLSRLTIF